MLINNTNKIINRLRWKYFIGEYKPKEQDKLEKQFANLSSTDKETVKEYKVLLDTIETNKSMRDELGVNAYVLYPLGMNCYINFKDLSNLVMYKVHDLTGSKKLFEGKTKAASADQIKKQLDKFIVSDDNYIKNFAKGYIVIALPEGVDDKALDIENTYKDLAFKSVNFDKKNNTLIIAAN